MALTVISLGAGVQSTTMALMAAEGEFDFMPDAAIFADTQSEPAAVYRHLKWLMSPGILPFPVHIVTAGSLRDEITGKRPDGRRSWGRPPMFVVRDDGEAGMLNRQCTRRYKIDPIRKKMRHLCGLKPHQRVKGIIAEQLIGISMDEIFRMKPSRDSWIRNRWPLIEKRMDRRQCLKWLSHHSYPIPTKSACTFCPFRDDAGWRELRDKHPTDWLDAVEVDRAIRIGMPGVDKSKAYVHRSLNPLDQVDLRTDEECGQLNMFLNECEGMCGV